MLGSSFLLVVSSDREQTFFLFYNNNIGIFVYQFQHLVLKFMVVLSLTDLYLHAWFQGKVILCSNHIVYQNNTVGKQ